MIDLIKVEGFSLLPMEILENGTEYLKDFIRLNEDWIRRYFELEEADLELRENPFSIIEEGGFIFTLVEDNVACGVCALFNHGGGEYELAKMAVDPEYQGKKFGSILMRAVLDKLETLDAKRVYLYSNTILESAISLYKKNGFDTLSVGQHPAYKRANILMEKQFYFRKDG